MIISFTGTQSGMTSIQKKELRKAFERLKISELHHGDCIGADAEANAIALELGCEYFCLYPSNLSAKRAYCFPDISRYNEWLKAEIKEDVFVRYKIQKIKPALERNKDIVGAGQILIACPKEFKHTIRSGTWATVRNAWHSKKEVIVIPPMKEEEEL